MGCGKISKDEEVHVFFTHSLLKLQLSLIQTENLVEPFKRYFACFGTLRNLSSADYSKFVSEYVLINLSISKPPTGLKEENNNELDESKFLISYFGLLIQEFPEMNILNLLMLFFFYTNHEDSDFEVLASSIIGQQSLSTFRDSDYTSFLEDVIFQVISLPCLVFYYCEQNEEKKLEIKELFEAKLCKSNIKKFTSSLISQYKSSATDLPKGLKNLLGVRSQYWDWDLENLYYSFQSFLKGIM